MMTSQPAANHSADNGSADSPGDRDERAKPSRLRKWLFRLTAVVALPLLLLVLV